MGWASDRLIEERQRREAFLTDLPNRWEDLEAGMAERMGALDTEVARLRDTTAALAAVVDEVRASARDHHAASHNHHSGARDHHALSRRTHGKIEAAGSFPARARDAVFSGVVGNGAWVVVGLFASPFVAPLVKGAGMWLLSFLVGA